MPQDGDCERRRYLEKQIVEVRKRVTRAEAPAKKKKGAAAGEPPPAKVRLRLTPVRLTACLRQGVRCVCSPFTLIHTAFTSSTITSNTCHSFLGVARASNI